jgi:inosine triphosphate pyrophosphatase
MERASWDSGPTESAGTISKDEKAQLSKLRSEFDRIKKVKAEQAAQQAPTASTSAGPPQDDSKYYTKDGKIKNPKRSIYYDTVFNPCELARQRGQFGGLICDQDGVPPPGMPYKERCKPLKALLSWALSSDSPFTRGVGRH